MRNRKWFIILICLFWSIGPSAGLSEQLPKDGFASFVDFQNPNIGFLAIDQSPPDANSPELSLEAEGAKLTMVGDGTPYLIIDVAGLLKEEANKLERIEVLVEVENPDGNFNAVSGEMVAYTGAEKIGRPCNWSVYLEHKNPNIAKFVFSDADLPDGAPVDFLILSKKVDNAIESGEAPSNLILREIRFRDADKNLLPVDVNAVFELPEGFGEIDRSNLLAVKDEILVDGAQGTSAGWGQAVVLPTAKNEGPLDAALLVPGCVVTVSYTSNTPPELIFQSWTEGAPEQAGWAKIAPHAVNDSGTVCQFVYDDMISAFGGDDLVLFLDQFYVGDTGEELAVTAIAIGLAQ